MADEDKASSPAKARTEISYCPEMGIYHFRQADGKEFLFDTPRLLADLDAGLKGTPESRRYAEFMSLLTGFARQFPHKVVSFGEDGCVNLSELVKPEKFGEDDPPGSGPGQSKG